jgi:hypothetical protein
MLLQVTDKGLDFLDNLRQNRINASSKVLAHLSNDELTLQLKALKSLLKASELHLRKIQEFDTPQKIYAKLNVPAGKISSS